MTASQIALSDCSEEVGEELGYIGALLKRPGSWNNKRLLFIYLKKNRHLKLKNLVLFYVREEANIWAH